MPASNLTSISTKTAITRRGWLAACAAIVPAVAGNKKEIPIGTAGDEYVELKANICIELADIYDAVGVEDMPKGIAVVKLSIKPRGNEKLRLNPDDFTLLSYHDGQRSSPFTPSQIAGSTTIQLKPGTSQTIGIGQVSNGPVWGGLGGSRPRELPGNGGGVGSGGSVTNGVEAGKVEENKSNGGESKLLTALKAKQLKAGDIEDWTNGLLYFPLEGKQKLKDLALLYKSPAGRLVLAFGR